MEIAEKDKKLMDALEEFIKNYNGVLDLNDTAEFIYHEREHLLKLLKEWDEGDK